MDAQSITYLVLGLALGLFGWVLYWAGLPLISGVIGACAGGALGFVAASAFPGPQWLPAVSVGAGVVLGVILGVYLMRALQIYFFFAAGAVLGGSAAFHFVQGGSLREFIGGPGTIGAYLLIIASALVAGLLLVKLRRFIVAFATSVAGAIFFTFGLPPEWRALGLPISFLVFFCVQIGLVRKFVDTEKFDNRMKKYGTRGTRYSEEDALR